MKRESLFRHLKAVVLFCKKRCAVEEIAKTLSAQPLYIRKFLKSKPIRVHVVQLTQSFIEKARGHFGQTTTVLPYPKALAYATSEDGK